MVKKAVIEILLVDESSETTNKIIEEEISYEISQNLNIIPWAAGIENVKVTNK